MENLMQYARKELKSYLGELNECDEVARKEALDRYLKRVGQLFDMAGIDSIDTYELEDKIKDAIKYDYSNDMKFYDRKTNREEEYDDIVTYMKRSEEFAEKIAKTQEKQEITNKAIKSVQEIIQNECKESSDSMKLYLEQMLNAANNVTKKEVISQGYYNINDFLSELSRVPLQVTDYVSYDYDERIKKARDMSIDELDDVLKDFSRNTHEMGVPSFKDKFDTKSLYEQYLSGGPKMELNLGTEDLGIKLCVVDSPNRDANGNIERGLAISKSILEQAVNENNPNITRDDENYVRVKTESFYFLVKEEEHELAIQSKQKEKGTKREEKPSKKEKKDPDVYIPML